MVVVTADPKRHRRGRIVDEYRAHVCVGRHQILHRLAGLGIEPHDAVGAHRGCPEFTILVEIGPVRESVFRQAVLDEFFCLGVELRDLVRYSVSKTRS